MVTMQDVFISLGGSLTGFLSCVVGRTARTYIEAAQSITYVSDEDKPREHNLTVVIANTFFVARISLNERRRREFAKFD
ncbi:hypothetical protein HY490_05940 [Candidatus Woesearchaeota archaeon]|nr:hypothetical protein [Candidatus Woesearchaeota archaeon]